MIKNTLIALLATLTACADTEHTEQARLSALGEPAAIVCYGGGSEGGVSMQCQLPDKCPTCGKPAKNAHLSLSWPPTESADYECGLSLHCYRGKTAAPTTRSRCEKDPAEIKQRKREAQIDKAVAAALMAVKATHEECQDFQKRMDRAQWGTRRDGIWKLLPPSKDT